MKIILRLATEKDLHLFEEIRGEKLTKLHLDRLKKQKMNKVEYFLAFIDKKPAGHMMLNYKAKRKWYTCPILEDLYVKESERNKGIATQIINFAEKHLKDKKYKELALDVETHEIWLKKFYEDLGFKKINGIHKLIWINKDKGNIRETSFVYHLRKKL